MNDAGENKEGLAAHDWASEAGKRWLAQLDRFESMIEPIGKALLDQAAYSASETVVDIGCGGGWTTRQIASAVGGGGSCSVGRPAASATIRLPDACPASSAACCSAVISTASAGMAVLWMERS